MRKNLFPALFLTLAALLAAAPRLPAQPAAEADPATTTLVQNDHPPAPTPGSPPVPMPTPAGPQLTPAGPQLTPGEMSPELLALAAKRDKTVTEADIKDAERRLRTSDKMSEKEMIDLDAALVSSRVAKEIAELKGQKDRLEAENALRTEKKNADIADLAAQIERLTQESALRLQQSAKDLAESATQKEKLTAELELADLREKQAVDALTAENAKLDLEIAALSKKSDLAAAQAKAALQPELIALQTEKDKLAAQNAVLAAKLEERNTTLQAQQTEAALRLQTLQSRLAELDAEIAARDKRETWDSQANREMPYPENPVVNGDLFISDRRIELNGVIMLAVAENVAERINYYNNKDVKAPIFIIIDWCPGGSVMAGYKIIRAMEASQAPVHVVVKSFAASMAAYITTMADKSYVFPNAVILHHQMLSMLIGNMTELKDQMKITQRWWDRLATPASKKLGYPSVDAFVKDMYVHDTLGDWEEFGDEAVKLKWAGQVVNNIREESQDKGPDHNSEHRRSPYWPFYDNDQMKEQTDADGRSFVRLPRLGPGDCWFLYNRDNYYR